MVGVLVDHGRRFCGVVGGWCGVVGGEGCGGNGGGWVYKNSGWVVRRMMNNLEKNFMDKNEKGGRFYEKI